MTITIDIAGPRLCVRFTAPFDLESYGLFLRTKRLPESEIAYDWCADAYTLTAPARFARLLGEGGAAASDPAPLSLPAHLFDYQAHIVRSALTARRHAVWADTGLGKTAMFLEWARQVCALTGGRVLILSPLAVIPQTVAEAARWYGDALPVEVLPTRDALAAWCTGEGSGLAITNWEKLTPGVLSELGYLAGLVVDESSRLRTGGGVQKWNLIKSARGIEYKLSCTATPAPNEAMEYASQASFLEKLRSEGEVLWTYFTRDKRGNWHVKPHARGAFYRFMASWSIYLRDPAHYGWTDILSSLPPAEYHEERLSLTDEQRTEMQTHQVRAGTGMLGTERMGIQQRAKLSQIAKGFVYEGAGDGKGRSVRRIPSLKPARVADIARQEVAEGRQVLVWTVFDEESAIVAERLAQGQGPRVGTLHGSMKEAARLPIIDAFRDGDVDVLISKAQLLGYGLNFQNCRSMIFSGFDDSFERMYQAVRRAYRFGQTETVHVYVPYIPELEGLIFDNVQNKERAFLRDVAEMEGHYIQAMEEDAHALENA